MDENSSELYYALTFSDGTVYEGEMQPDKKSQLIKELSILSLKSVTWNQAKRETLELNLDEFNYNPKYLEEVVTGADNNQTELLVTEKSLARFEADSYGSAMSRFHHATLSHRTFEWALKRNSDVEAMTLDRAAYKPATVMRLARSLEHIPTHLAPKRIGQKGINFLNAYADTLLSADEAEQVIITSGELDRKLKT